MLTPERISDLIRLMEGESEFSSDSECNIPESRDELYAYNMALQHVRFVERYGLDANHVVAEGKTYESYPGYFQDWLNNGCKGIEESEIEKYLKTKPIWLLQTATPS
jgi:hypothetical protein